MAPSVKVIIVPYCPEWPKKYQDERSRIQETLGSLIKSIEHICSTSVPGLGAKSIIDIMVGVESRRVADMCQKKLETIGYDDVTPQPGETEWFYCLGRGNRGLYYHVHLVIHQSSHWKKHLKFRDYLRFHPERADEYYAVKRDLADNFGADRDGYSEAKTGFIVETLRLAQELNSKPAS